MIKMIWYLSISVNLAHKIDSLPTSDFNSLKNLQFTKNVRDSLNLYTYSSIQTSKEVEYYEKRAC